MNDKRNQQNLTWQEMLISMFSRCEQRIGRTIEWEQYSLSYLPEMLEMCLECPMNTKVKKCNAKLCLQIKDTEQTIGYYI